MRIVTCRTIVCNYERFFCVLGFAIPVRMTYTVCWARWRSPEYKHKPLPTWLNYVYGQFSLAICANALMVLCHYNECVSFVSDSGTYAAVVYFHFSRNHQTDTHTRMHTQRTVKYHTTDQGVHRPIMCNVCMLFVETRHSKRTCLCIWRPRKRTECRQAWLQSRFFLNIILHISHMLFILCRTQ